MEAAARFSRRSPALLSNDGDLIPTLEPRANNTDHAPYSSSNCTLIRPDQLVISRAALIGSLTTCIFITCVCLLAVTALLYRERSRRRQEREAHKWGRRSKYIHRISIARKEVDDAYSRQYKGCLVNDFENPEMGSGSPVEMMLPEQKVWEAPAVPPKVKEKGRRKSKVGSLFFDSRVGLWLPKR